MPTDVFLGFDFGYKRIGVAVGQSITASARALTTVNASAGEPQWAQIDKLIQAWQPAALIVGLPTCLDGSEQYTTPAARHFAQALAQRYHCPVHLVDERLTTKEARARLFAQGGYREIKRAQVDALAAVLILEQWLAQSTGSDS
ncbi:MAG: Holliday junction resolvase RuvX [Legionellaceae bacterium]|nr:Holliday junction resolvase RuvX [Legionellaceae bacterium]